ncbi:MAG: hypothetical protein ACREE1_04645 [Stellaceae bacterium]
MTDTWDEAERWRERAKEVRTMADQFRSAVQREQLLRIAESYDTIAKDTEGRLSKASSRLATAIDRESATSRDTRADRSL